MSNVDKRMFLTVIAFGSFVIGADAAARQAWLLVGDKRANYETGIDDSAMYNAQPSSYLWAKADGEGFGALMQSFSADSYLRKRVRFSGYVKSENVTRWAGLWMRVNSKSSPEYLTFDNMQDRPIKGTTGWRSYEVILDVPAEAATISLGLVLDGPGRVWLNNVTVDIVGGNVPVTGRSAYSH
jgi:hypothetical protein